MRYLILSDIHSNYEALTAVLRHVRRKHWDKIAFLGDLVGYGANPNQVMETLIHSKALTAIRGNHDKVCSGIEDGELFNRIALEAARWTRSRLTRANLRWLHDLPQGPLEVDETFAICHGTPIDEDAYIFGEIEALNVFRNTTHSLCFFGHSHFPIVFALSPDSITTMLPATPTCRFRLYDGFRYLVNPGSVGQPRDGKRDAAFAIFDSTARTVAIHRVPYDIATAQHKIRRAGLPRPLADRLALGR
jgi:predicted phosphodiesterase